MKRIQHYAFAAVVGAAGLMAACGQTPQNSMLAAESLDAHGIAATFAALQALNLQDPNSHGPGRGPHHPGDPNHHHPGDPNRHHPHPGDPNQHHPGEPPHQPDDPNQPLPDDPNQPLPGDPNQPLPGDPNQPLPGDPTGSAFTVDDPDSPSSPDPVCDQIFADLADRREALAATDEWKALVATPEWADVQTVIDQAKAENCKPFDASPSDACAAIAVQMKGALSVAQHTAEYQAAEQTREWRAVHRLYKSARKHHCWN